MSSLDSEHAETHGGSERRRHRSRRRSSMNTTDGSFQFSDTSEDEYHSWRSSITGRGGGEDECTPHGAVWGEVDLESGSLEMKKACHDTKEEEIERDCRICHLSLMGNGICDDSNNDGIGIQLGCACKGDLGNAHKQCAETWFKIKGDITCEICGAIAVNIGGEQAPDLLSNATAEDPLALVASSSSERHNYCHGRRVMNFLLACMIFAFVISWLFHFNVMN